MKVKINKKELPKDGKSTLTKALKNVKNRLQKETNKARRIKTKQENAVKLKKVVKRKKKNLPQAQRKRGIVYVGHIPHGFYEEQMKEYFTQFGRVTRVRLARSKNTGKSRGYGYVEFQAPDVAKIAAETMNNYLMAGRLVKATYIPPEKQHNGFFTKLHWTKEHYPKKMNRLQEVKAQNSAETKEEHKIFVKKSVKRLNNLSKKLKAQGIDLELNISSQIV